MDIKATTALINGRYLALNALSIDDISIEDIAFGLSNIKRYNGHSNITVAEHSSRVARALLAQKAHPTDCFTGLLHDAAEAYIGDITTPVKQMLSLAAQKGFDELHTRITAIIFNRFHIPIEYAKDTPECVKLVDRRILLNEQSYIERVHPDISNAGRFVEGDPLENTTFQGYGQEEAEKHFLTTMSMVLHRRYLASPSPPCTL